MIFERRTGNPAGVALDTSVRDNRRGRRWLLATALAGIVGMGCGGIAMAREPLGIFGQWGAFQDSWPVRCYAVAEPVEHRRGPGWSPFAAVSQWPGKAVRNQLHIRLRKEKQRGTPVTLLVDGRRFALVAGGADAWAPDAGADAAIVAAIRGGSEMRVEARDEKGRRFIDAYALRGAATAIDAAALACANIR